jgi:hypothetical protein
MSKTIYIDVKHMDFWWGIYEFCNKTSWEDIVMYDMDNGEFKEIARTCACSRADFESGLEDIENNPEERDFVWKIKEFLRNESITYHYYYDKLNDEDFYQVPFEAKRNVNNIKPCSIETWYHGDGIGVEEAQHCTIDFCKMFLNTDVMEVKFKEIISRKDALESYVEDIKSFNQYNGVCFSDELIQQLQNEWNVSREKVLEILKRSM